ncbi:hypothetical protein K474DRAFT_396057 [Panus rudis PR-1116 ss-1]|nr:hypothetical protein K474DRAFT_396057 [Panus rudis PR-1116 ss-1]
MPGFFSSIADKAQSALNASPLAQHIPGSHPSGSQSQGEASGGFKYSHALESIHHQLRTFQQQYSSSTSPAQKIVTTQKGIALDFDSVSRDSQAHSKEIYLWGQTEPEDLKDVTDRLAWLNYVQGQLANNLAKQLDAARAPFKALRDAENALAPRRALRNNIQNQIARVENENARNSAQKVAELKIQLQKAEADDLESEREIDVLKRKAVRESEQLKWQAFREYGEKVILLSQAAATIVPVLPPIPPTPVHPYTGADVTASVRASLQKALDTYTPGSSQIKYPEQSAADIKRSDTRSFGETHRAELASINSTDPTSRPSIPLTPPPTASVPPSSYAPPAGPPPHAVSQQSSIPSDQSVKSVPVLKTPPSSSPQPGNQSPPLNPAKLNQTPAPIPIPAEKASPVVSPDPSDPAVKVPSVLPTVAETGMPLRSAGPDGPGPSSGSLLDIKGSPTTSSALPPPSYAGGPSTSAAASAGDEKKYESAEEEKKRLEREERERILREGGSHPDSNNQGHPPPPGGDADLPPYQEF